MRLDKYLAETAQCTRSEAKTLLQKGKVTVNGTLCKKGDTQLRETDVVAVEGRPLAYQKFVYIMLNKPEGVVSASTDKRDTTVVDLLGDAYPRRELFPAGRLDKTSTGFVLLTDDGGFAHDILAPKRHGSKTYTVTLDTPLTAEMKAGFAAGVTLADGTALSPAEVEALTPDGLTVLLPNKALSAAQVTNYTASQSKNRRFSIQPLFYASGIYSFSHLHGF